MPTRSKYRIEKLVRYGLPRDTTVAILHPTFKRKLIQFPRWIFISCVPLDRRKYQEWRSHCGSSGLHRFSTVDIMSSFGIYETIKWKGHTLSHYTSTQPHYRTCVYIYIAADIKCKIVNERYIASLRIFKEENLAFYDFNDQWRNRKFSPDSGVLHHCIFSTRSVTCSVLCNFTISVRPTALRLPTCMWSFSLFGVPRIDIFRRITIPTCSRRWRN